MYLLYNLGHFRSIECLLPIFPLCNSSLGDIRENLLDLKNLRKVLLAVCLAVHTGKVCMM
jgi:hypothetical protein